MSKKIKLLIIGCGLIGTKRALNLDPTKSRLVYCYDINLISSKKFSKEFKCESLSNYRNVDLRNIDAVFISTTHNNLAKIASFFIKKKKHVFVEKPAALNFKEITKLVTLKKKYKKTQLGVGLNHRFHPSFIKAFQIFHSGKIGKLMFIRAQYGHGGRIDYDKEWRAQPKISGGGELIDQGTHLIDLSQCFLGDLNLINGNTRTYFWNMKVDDNCFLTLENKNKKIAFLQASCTEWKNTFNFEIYGEIGKLQIIGLGGSYGTETLKFFKMKKKMGPPRNIIYKFPGKDISWKLEQNNFFDIILKKTKIKKFASIYDMQKIYKLIFNIYKNKK
jgi:predicted dehydrogenase